MSLTGFLSYSRVNWQQSPSKSTPLSAANLNVMDAGIKNNNDMISNLRDEVTQLNSNLTNNICTNLLNPTLETSSQNGVTCTNNGDGTYTLNGTATNGTAIFVLINSDRNFFEQVKGKTLKFICCENGSLNTYFGYVYGLSARDSVQVNKEGTAFTAINDFTDYNLSFQVYNGHTVNNLIIKPMLTTNLNATYDDFVPYTGSTGSINGDVAELNSNFNSTEKFITGFVEFEIAANSTGSIELNLSNKLPQNAEIYGVIGSINGTLNPEEMSAPNFYVTGTKEIQIRVRNGYSIALTSQVRYMVLYRLL